MRGIAEGTWTCGDPGVQYEDTIQRWHTCKTSGPINSSNPCSEYMFLDNSACNLASLNLMKFVRTDGAFDVERFKSAAEIFIAAQEIIVDNASYPTETIALNSHLFRPLGLGFANLGSLIMSMGLPYDSDEGRGIAGAITAIMHLHAYTQSARIAEKIGTFEGYAKNREPMLQVMEMHRDAVKRIHPTCPDYLRNAAQRCGDEAVELGRRFGYRNSQVTVLAPTGTIAFMMDCDTTGVEPDIALVKYKLLAGGGMLKIVNRTVPMALRKLGYPEQQIADVVKYIDETDMIEGAPHLQEKHMAVFDCAFKPAKGKRSIHYMAHLKMMAAAQPFLSGAISKTVNMPQESTVEEIMHSCIEGWKLGLKAVAIYRDGSKRSQPLNTSKNNGSTPSEAVAKEVDSFKSRIAELDEEVASLRTRLGAPARHRLPDTRQAITHKFDIAGHEGYITVGLFDDGTPGELFITMAKEGSTISGLMDSFATAISYGLQYGVPLKFYVDKFAHVRFEPSGWTGNKQIPYAKSIMDYLFRWLGAKFLGPEYGATEVSDNQTLRPTEEEPQQKLQFTLPVASDAPTCGTCGSIMVVNGPCFKCENCGGTSGCS
jgi:ribonucleoside-diphosphate reductase alpha chain